ILRGNFGPALPRYLRPDMFQAVRNGIDRITIFHGPIERAAQELKAGGFDGFNLSDLFEYLSLDTCRNLYGTLLNSGSSSARLAYWNMLVPRGCPPALAHRIRPLNALAATLNSRDMAFFYSAL